MSIAGFGFWFSQVPINSEIAFQYDFFWAPLIRMIQDPLLHCRIIWMAEKLERVIDHFIHRYCEALANQSHKHIKEVASMRE